MIKESTEDIINFYNKKYFINQKDNYGKLGWRTLKGQIDRFEILLDIGVSNGDIVLDYGSGYGDLLSFLMKKKYIIKYLGVDINSSFIKSSKNKYGYKYFKLIKSYEDINLKFDWFISSGAFTVHTSNNTLLNTIDYYYKRVNKGLSFNLLSNEPNEPTMDSNSINIRGYNPKWVFDILKSKYNKVKIVPIELNNNYLNFYDKLDEFNIYIYK